MNLKRVKDHGSQKWLHDSKPVAIRFYRAIFDCQGHKVTNGKFCVYKSAKAKSAAEVSRSSDNKRIGEFRSLPDAIKCAEAA